MIWKPYEYQKVAVDHLMVNSSAALFLDMGLGKTTITLTAIVELLKTGKVRNVLIVAPKRVAQSVWSAEIRKWKHLNHLTISKILGSTSQRKKALQVKANIHIINKENLCWLLGHLKGTFPWTMLVVDELSAFKSHTSKRFKALCSVKSKINRVVGLTGTPRPNGLIDLWSQIYLLDFGERLGTKISHYREMYFNPGQTRNHVVFNYTLKGTRKKDAQDPVLKVVGLDVYEALIYSKISDICISMKNKDYIELPSCLYRTVNLDMDAQTRAKYIEFEKEQVLQISNETVTAVSAAVLSNKLLQFANGAVYVHKPDTTPRYVDVHNIKLEALEEIIEEANGAPVMVFYWFKHDLVRLKEHFSKIKPRELKTEKDIDDWNTGKISLFLVHPASAGHGLNLQAGGNIIVWYSMIWSLELYLQANARLMRQGQLNGVIIHHLIMEGTLDFEAYERLLLREAGQNKMMEATKALVRKYSNGNSILHVKSLEEEAYEVI